jgi:hypothetical protein
MNKKIVMIIITILMLVITNTTIITSASTDEQTENSNKITETFNMCRIESNGKTITDVITLPYGRSGRGLLLLKAFYYTSDSTTVIHTMQKTITITGPHALEIYRRGIFENFQLPLPLPGFIGTWEVTPVRNLALSGLAFGVTVTYYT